MLYKALVCLALLSYVYGFTVKQDDGSTTPYFVHPKDRPSGISPRIIGGEEVSPHSYPFQVALTLYTESSAYFCGGTLISNQLVLTAAHCLD
ncbi:chymotrypsin BI-like, partial [Anoplophora glabripennis]